MNKKVDEEFKNTHDEYLLQCICTEMKNKINNVINKINQYEIISGYYDSNYDGIEDTYSHDIKEELLYILKEQ